MKYLFRFFLPFVVLLSGCATFHAEKYATDGSHLSVDSNNLFIQKDIGAIDFAQADTKLTVQGIKSQGQMEILDALNNLAKVLGSAAKP